VRPRKVAVELLSLATVNQSGRTAVRRNHLRLNAVDFPQPELLNFIRRGVVVVRT
jgi:hypothetical protein